MTIDNQLNLTQRFEHQQQTRMQQLKQQQQSGGFIRRAEQAEPEQKNESLNCVDFMQHKALRDAKAEEASNSNDQRTISWEELGTTQEKFENRQMQQLKHQAVGVRLTQYDVPEV